MAKEFQISFNILGQIQSTFGQSFATASDKMTALNTRVSGLKAQMKELDRDFKQNKVGVLEYSGSYEKLTTQLHNAQKAQRDFQKVVALQDKARSKRDSARSNMVGAIETAAIVAGPVYAAMGFESAMSGVAKQVDGARSATGELTDVFYEAQTRVMQASKDMMIMPDVMAKAFTMAAKSGVQGMENIDKFARMGIMMGTAFEAPADAITEQFAKIGSARGINLATEEGIAKLEALADTVNYLDDQSNASGADIISVLKRIAGTATSLLPTISNETLAGMSTAMLQMGETAETSGTALNSLFTKVAAAPTQAKSFHSALAQLGLTAEELQSGALKDGEGAIMNLFERIGQLDAASKNNVLAELFGSEHIDTLSKISGNYEQFIETIKKGSSEAAKGSMAREFEVQSENTAKQLEGLKASAARASIVLANVLLPPIKTLSGWLSTGADWVANFSREHSTLSNVLVTTGAAILGGTVALSGMAWAGWAVIYPLIQLYTWSKKVEIAQKAAALATRVMVGAQWLFNAAMTANPVGIIIVGIAALIATGYLLYENWDLIKQKSSEVWGVVVGWFGKAYEVATQFISELPGKIAYGVGYMIGFYASLPERAAYYFQYACVIAKHWTVALITSVIGLLLTLPDKATIAFDTFLSNATQWSMSVYDAVVNWFLQIPNKIMDAFNQASSYLDGLKNRLKNFTGTIGVSFSSGLEAGGTGVQVASNATGGIYGQGAFLTTFAENSPEAAIPLDGSPRALSLWTQAGEMLGVQPAGRAGDIQVSFAPVINAAGGNVQEIRQMLKAAEDELIDRLQAIQHQQRRTSYA